MKLQILSFIFKMYYNILYYVRDLLYISTLINAFCFFCISVFCYCIVYLRNDCNTFKVDGGIPPIKIDGTPMWCAPPILSGYISILGKIVAVITYHFIQNAL